VSRFALHDIPHFTVTLDIHKNVEAGFAQMSRKRDWGDGWYTEDDIDFVVIQADVLFIYASTFIKYLGDSKFRLEKCLQILRQMKFTA